jgi:hypothetical protein
MSVHSIKPRGFSRQGTYFPRSACLGYMWATLKVADRLRCKLAYEFTLDPATYASSPKAGVATRTQFSPQTAARLRAYLEAAASKAAREFPLTFQSVEPVAFFSEGSPGETEWNGR